MITLKNGIYGFTSVVLASASGFYIQDRGNPLEVRTYIEHLKRNENEIELHREFLDIDLFGAERENCINELKRGTKVEIKAAIYINKWIDRYGNHRERTRLEALIIQDVSDPSRVWRGAGYEESKIPIRNKTKSKPKGKRKGKNSKDTLARYWLWICSLVS